MSSHIQSGGAVAGVCPSFPHLFNAFAHNAIACCSGLRLCLVAFASRASETPVGVMSGVFGVDVICFAVVTVFVSVTTQGEFAILPSGGKLFRFALFVGAGVFLSLVELFLSPDWVTFLVKHAHA